MYNWYGISSKHIQIKMINNNNDKMKCDRGQPELNRRPLDLQSNALPLSYTPATAVRRLLKLCFHI